MMGTWCEEEADTLFNDADINNDGRLSRKELKQMFKKLGYKLTQRDVTKMLDSFDSDISRDLDIDEFRELVKDMCMMNKRFEEINNAFISFKGGKLMTMDELKELCSHLQEKLDDARIIDITTRFCKQKHGLINFDQFAKAYAYNR